MWVTRWMLLALLPCAMLAAGCGALPLPFAATPLPPNTLVYDAPTTLTIKTGTTLPGTTLVYLGENENKQAQMVVAGYIAPKQVADTVDWQGTPVPNVNLKLTTRVVAFDKNAITLAGTAHIEIANIIVQPGGTPGTAMLEFNSLQYLGRINPRVFLRLDLRVVSFSDANIVLAGTANIKIEQ